MVNLLDFRPDNEDRNTPEINDGLCEIVDSVDLRDLDIGCSLYVQGIHPSTKYYLRKIQDEEIKIWNIKNRGCFRGPIGALSYFSEKRDTGSGILKVGFFIQFPYFCWRGDELMPLLNYCSSHWVDSIKTIKLQRSGEK